MALSITVMRGWKIEVGDSVLEVLAISDPYDSVTVSVDGGRRIELTASERVEVAPDVFASVGLPAHRPLHGALSRIAFEAPRRIRIQRMQDAERVTT